MPVSQGFGGVGVPGATLKAWVRFAANGTIIAAFNVASVNRAGAGTYQVNFTVPMSGANYIGKCSSGAMNTGTTGAYFTMQSATAAQANISALSSGGTPTDAVQSWEFYE